MTKLSGPMLAPRSGGKAKGVIVLLHGYGADGEDLIGLGHHWGQTMPDMLFVSPNAPERCAENPFGYQWFPLKLDRTISRVEGAPVARESIVEFLDELWRQTGLTAADTFLVGFSQGAMMALHTGLSLKEPVRGIVSFSGALIPPEGFEEGLSPKVPICLIHGDFDQVVDPALTAQAAEALRAKGYAVTAHIARGMAHGISPDGLDVATDFIAAQLAAAKV